MRKIMSIEDSYTGTGLVLPDADNFLDEPLELTEEDKSPVIPEPPGGDPRLKRLSYSAGNTLHGCPRKFQLERLRTKIVAPVDWKRTLTFQFGHTVGDGIADIMQNLPRNEVIIRAFQGWKLDLFEENEKQKKSFIRALYALYKFYALREQGHWEDYELVFFNGKPAIELSFKIVFPDGYTQRGYVDLVLRNKETGEYVIIEIKTSSGTYINPASYKNSAQAIGYSVVLDTIAPGISSYSVDYMVWMSRLDRWEQFSFPKSYSQRAFWIRDRIYDNETIQRLIDTEGSYGNWPMQGEHCNAFNSICEYMDSCQLSTLPQVIPLKQIHLNPEELDRYGKPYDFTFDLMDILENMQ